jgi:hypothetical protein
MMILNTLKLSGKKSHDPICTGCGDPWWACQECPHPRPRCKAPAFGVIDFIRHVQEENGLTLHATDGKLVLFKDSYAGLPCRVCGQPMPHGDEQSERCIYILKRDLPPEEVKVEEHS